MQRGTLIVIAVFLASAGNVSAQALYKYRSEDGSWIYSDRPPPGEQEVETRVLPTGDQPPFVTVSTQIESGIFRFAANNEFHVPVEIILALDSFRHVALPPPNLEMRWLVAPRSGLTLLELDVQEDGGAPDVGFRYLWIPGDPASQHAPQQPYRAPFAVAKDFPLTQAYPMASTHNTPDSRYAVDIAMPVGTNVYAARSGVVFEVASNNFRSGVDKDRFAAEANLVRIMHDDGTHAVYAHLNWNTIRVRPGDRVRRGEYIADSGNTGFSSGPHLHFAVLQNMGMRLESVPFVFEGPNSSAIVPSAGNILSAY
jgi:murein DD-endopeptidase MepM/ murein hydrolase activator NlpD